jgi:transposase
VLARKTVKAKAHELGGLLAWAADKTVAAGFAGLAVACEPTGHRWKALMGLADAGGHGFVCVQSLAVARAREGDDYTRDKMTCIGSDSKLRSWPDWRETSPAQTRVRIDRVGNSRGARTCALRSVRRSRCPS